MDAMFYEVFKEEEKVLKRYLPNRIRAGFSPNTIQSDKKRHPPSGLISIRTQSIVPIQWLSDLSGILARSAGFDHLPALRSRNRNKVSFGYLPEYCSRAVAEHSLLMILALERRLKRQIKQFDSFSRSDITGNECLGRKLLVVGVGRIGKEIVKLGRGIGMEVKGVDIVKRVKNLRYVTLKEGIRFADIIVCALPLTKLTRGMLDFKLLRNTKSGIVFINISRGEISPIRDLKRLLNKKILAGVALDVYEHEAELAESMRSKNGHLTPIGKEILSLRDREDVYLTPHNAFNTHEALERKAKQSSDAIARFLKDGVFPNPVSS